MEILQKSSLPGIVGHDLLKIKELLKNLKFKKSELHIYECMELFSWKISAVGEWLLPKVSSLKNVKNHKTVKFIVAFATTRALEINLWMSRSRTLWHLATEKI